MQSKYRGHKIYWEFFYSDTNQRTIDNPYRACGHCNKPQTEEGHDGCLGTLPGIMNACCGHGESNEAYVQFPDGLCVRGRNAEILIGVLKRERKNKHDDNE